MSTIMADIGKNLRREIRADRGDRGREASSGGSVNVNETERSISTIAGGLLAAWGLSRGSLPGLLLAGVGASLIYRGATGHCHLYEALAVDTRGDADVEKRLQSRGIHVEQAMLINRSPEDLYQFWRQFENLPGFMRHLKSVEVLDERRSRWITEAPAIAGGTVEWEAQITRDEPNQLIAWRSLPESDIDATGEIRFTKAMGDRGTEVHVSMEYLPPAGRLGHWIATLFGEDPRQQMRDDLRSFKSLMEVGEVPSIQGQSRGTCLGAGRRADSEP